MEIKLLKLSACINGKFYCFEDFTKPLWHWTSEPSVYAKTLTEEIKGIKIAFIKIFYSM